MRFNYIRFKKEAPGNTGMGDYSGWNVDRFGDGGGGFGNGNGLGDRDGNGLGDGYGSGDGYGYGSGDGYGGGYDYEYRASDPVKEFK